MHFARRDACGCESGLVSAHLNEEAGTDPEHIDDDDERDAHEVLSCMRRAYNDQRTSGGTNGPKPLDAIALVLE
jgi:hypothetical protein